MAESKNPHIEAEIARIAANFEALEKGLEYFKKYYTDYPYLNETQLDRPGFSLKDRAEELLQEVKNLQVNLHDLEVEKQHDRDAEKMLIRTFSHVTQNFKYYHNGVLLVETEDRRLEFDPLEGVLRKLGYDITVDNNWVPLSERTD